MTADHETEMNDIKQVTFDLPADAAGLDRLIAESRTALARTTDRNLTAALDALISAAAGRREKIRRAGLDRVTITLAIDGPLDTLRRIDRALIDVLATIGDPELRDFLMGRIAAPVGMRIIEIEAGRW